MNLRACLAAAALSTAALAAAPAAAQTLRWAAQNDILTMDPHSQNHATTNTILNHAYEGLTRYGVNYEIEPALATKWTFNSPTLVRFELRRGVKFHDGAPFTADDVVFSFERIRQPQGTMGIYVAGVKEVRKVDSHTVDMVLDGPNPILLRNLAYFFITNKAWAEKNNSVRVQDYKANEENFASRNANGTGAWILVAREPGVRTVVRRNPDWWGIKEGRAPGNVTEVIYTQVSADATRTAALLSGQVDFILDPPTQDVARLEKDAGTKVVRGQENRVVFFGFDQMRDELLYSSVKGKNPFKDVRVRTAVYQAIDIEALRSRTMRGSALPTGGITPSILASNPDAEKRLPYDPKRARELLTEAGYPSGFDVTLDCPNNRYVNDEEICLAVAAMLTRVGINTRVTAMPRATYFPKLEKHDTSFYMLGWGGAITDAQTTLDPVLRSFDKATGKGFFNYGRYSNPKLDALIDAAGVEPNADKRRELIRQALAEHNANVHHVPLHRQMIPWSMRQNIHVVHRADNVLIFESVRID